MVPAIQWIPTSRLRALPQLSEVKCENPTVTQDVKNGVSLPSSNPFLVSEEPFLSHPIVSARSLLTRSDMNDVALDGVDDVVDDINGASKSIEVGGRDEERDELSVSDDRLNRESRDQDDAVEHEVGCDKVKDESSKVEELQEDNKST